MYIIAHPPVSEMTYIVSSWTLNSTIPYHYWPGASLIPGSALEAGPAKICCEGDTDIDVPHKVSACCVHVCTWYSTVVLYLPFIQVSNTELSFLL